MINFAKVVKAAGYTTRHLSHNDYYEEGHKVEGYWFGNGAELLGLDGAKKQKDWESICANRHPGTGRSSPPALPRSRPSISWSRPPRRFRFWPWSEAIPGCLEDHQAAAQLAMQELERFAARRLRAGDHFDSEEVVRCGNIVALRYDHTAARGVGEDIDPQVHTHFLIANRVYDAVAGQMVRPERAGNGFRRRLRPRGLSQRASPAYEPAAQALRLRHREPEGGLRHRRIG